MNYTHIYNQALTLLGETPEAAGNGDYLTRAPILLAGIVSGYSAVSEILLPGSGSVTAVPVKMEDEFPLDARLAAPSALLLAARLVFDESSERSELLIGEAGKLTDSLTASVGRIREVY